MVEDAPMGGIMDLDTTRQMLFIGGVAKSIGKGLKSITRGVKKVAKSPLGKAALLRSCRSVLYARFWYKSYRWIF